METTFDHIAPLILHDLKAHFSISHIDACAIVGNLGHESGGFDKIFQIGKDGKPEHSTAAGIGLAQWSGTRHVQFMAFCEAEKISPIVIRSSVLFLIHELSGAYKRCVEGLGHEPTLLGKVSRFERDFEGAGVPAISSRYKWACRAQVLVISETGIV